jgi:hypothetical protein
VADLILGNQTLEYEVEERGAQETAKSRLCVGGHGPGATECRSSAGIPSWSFGFGYVLGANRNHHVRTDKSPIRERAAQRRARE